MSRLFNVLNAMQQKIANSNVVERDSGNTNFVTKRTDTDVTAWFGIGSGGTNHGLWSVPLNKWLVNCDSTRAFFNGGQIDSGRETIVPSAANTPTSKTITFGKTFIAAPNVVVTTESTVPGTIVTGVGVTDITTTGCKLWVTRTNTTQTIVNWIATSITQ